MGYSRKFLYFWRLFLTFGTFTIILLIFLQWQIIIDNTLLFVQCRLEIDINNRKYKNFGDFWATKVKSIKSSRYRPFA